MAIPENSERQEPADVSPRHTLKPLRSPLRSPLEALAGASRRELAPGLLAPLVVLASAAAHAAVFLSVSTLALKPTTHKEPLVVRVSDIPKPPPPPPVVVEEKKPEPPKPPPPEPPKVVKERKPRVRNDERLPPPPSDAPPPPPVEVRAGLSDSLAPGPGTGPAVAQGNSAEVAVNPEDARKPPPPAAPGPAPEPDPDSVPVTEAAADVPSKCPPIPDIPITDDAANAGITSGEIVIEVVVGSKGNILDARVQKGTGFDIDQVALREVKKLSCTPASVAGKAVAAKRKLIKIPIVF